jgi:hypothetical protein
MNKKIIIGGIAVILMGAGGAFFLFGSNPPDNVPRAQIQEPSLSTGPQDQEVPEQEMVELVSFNFVGFGPGKNHPGSFDSMRLEGETFVIDANSVHTGISALDTHLKTDDFFDAENHPNITFLGKNLGDSSISGILTLRGISKEIIVPATITDSSIVIDFLLDISQFGISFPGVNKEVQITAELTK